MPNRLAGQTSPYLQQHADNPVDWYPWGAEALSLARAEDKPILLSIGYSACHWCHVMAQESFEDAQTAALMNALFVNIKVDREERPDLDQIYQSAHHLLTQRAGGWPLTMFLTPDQKPFFGGTYFPRAARYGLPAFTDLLQQIAAAYRDQRVQIDAQNESMLEVLATTVPGQGRGVALTRAPVLSAARQLQEQFDEVEGGIGTAPKFPHPHELAFCLRVARITKNSHLRDLVILTLRQMACGGIYDQLGGGFCRYSVDAYWQIPHFEKMLYDNGPLLRLYADAWALTGDALFRRVCEDTAGWVMREMQAPQGGYYSSLDADSEHEEGRFHVWSREEFAAPLNEDEHAIAAAYFGIDRAPNFENRAWNPYVSRPLETLASQTGREPSQCESLLQSARAKLFAAREKRPRPARDEKILVGWNALMIEGMVHAARVFGRDDGNRSARRARQFLTASLWQQGRLLATYKDGHAHLNAYLDDYAFLLAALLESLQADYEDEILRLAGALANALLDHFEDRSGGGFFFTSDDHEALILRPKPGADNATPSGNGVAALALARLGYMTGETRYLRAAENTLQVFYAMLERHPAGHATLCTALEELLEPTNVVVLRGPREALGTWQRALSSRYLPGTLIFAAAALRADLPGTLDKPAGEAVNAYLCQGVSCQPPIEDIGALIANLETGLAV
jgi:uncharacterized protein YyaL (SSP411 family)